VENIKRVLDTVTNASTQAAVPTSANLETTSKGLTQLKPLPLPAAERCVVGHWRTEQYTAQQRVLCAVHYFLQRCSTKPFPALIALAQHLEYCLFRVSSTLQEYGDLTTLFARLQSLAKQFSANLEGKPAVAYYTDSAVAEQAAGGSGGSSRKRKLSAVSEGATAAAAAAPTTTAAASAGADATADAAGTTETTGDATVATALTATDSGVPVKLEECMDVGGTRALHTNVYLLY
jgi:hypothetical protein